MKLKDTATYKKSDSFDDRGRDADAKARDAADISDRSIVRSMLMAVAVMLAGSVVFVSATLAWFTQSVSSMSNRLAAAEYTDVQFYTVLLSSSDIVDLTSFGFDYFTNNKTSSNYVDLTLSADGNGITEGYFIIGITKSGAGGDVVSTYVTPKLSAYGSGIFSYRCLLSADNFDLISYSVKDLETGNDYDIYSVDGTKLSLTACWGDPPSGVNSIEMLQ